MLIHCIIKIPTLWEKHWFKIQCLLCSLVQTGDMDWIQCGSGWLSLHLCDETEGLHTARGQENSRRLRVKKQDGAMHYWVNPPNSSPAIIRNPGDHGGPAGVWAGLGRWDGRMMTAGTAVVPGWPHLLRRSCYGNCFPDWTLIQLNHS